MSQPTVTAAILVIGDEILSGRTKDKNIGHIAEHLTRMGIEVREVRVVPDIMDEIVAGVDALRRRYSYVFTTGGIGPTHDDITADSIAKALGVPIGEDPRAIALLLERIKPEDLNEARRRMARIPHGAELVQNPVSKAPGFMIENVIVMAGVPNIMQAMLDDVTPRLRTGTPLTIETVDARGLPEGAYAEALSRVAKDWPDTSIGSYPSYKDGTFHNQIVVRGRDPARVGEAKDRILTMLAALPGARVSEMEKPPHE